MNAETKNPAAVGELPALPTADRLSGWPAFDNLYTAAQMTAYATEARAALVAEVAGFAHLGPLLRSLATSYECDTISPAEARELRNLAAFLAQHAAAPGTQEAPHAHD